MRRVVELKHTSRRVRGLICERSLQARARLQLDLGAKTLVGTPVSTGRAVYGPSGWLAMVRQVRFDAWDTPKVSSGASGCLRVR